MRCPKSGNEFGDGFLCHHCGADRVTAYGSYDGYSAPDKNVQSDAHISIQTQQSSNVSNQDNFTVCWKCGEIIPKDARYCPSCGQLLFVKCPSCGKDYVAKYNYCPVCGVNRIEMEKRNTSKSSNIDSIAIIEHEEKQSVVVKVKVSFNVSSCKNDELICYAYFYHEDGSPIIQNDKRHEYYSPDGMIATSRSLVPDNDDSTFSNFELTIPASFLQDNTENKELRYRRICVIKLYSSEAKRFIDNENYQVDFEYYPKRQGSFHCVRVTPPKEDISNIITEHRSTFMECLSIIREYDAAEIKRVARRKSKKRWLFIGGLSVVILGFIGGIYLIYHIHLV